MRTAAENRATSSSVSCREHRDLAKSNMVLTKSSQPEKERVRETVRKREREEKNIERMWRT